MASPSPPDFCVVGVGTSAGGVEALWGLLAALPPDLDAAVLVVMHMAPHGSSELDRVLARRSRLRVVPATDGMAFVPGEVIVAQPDRHLMVEGDRVRVTRGPKECRVRPAVDVLFRSLAVHCGARAIGVVLSGMLDDGTAGLWAIRDRGGVCLVQDPAEPMFDGMPRAALEHVTADAVGPVKALAQEIERVAAGRRALAVAHLPEGMLLETRIAAESNALENGVMELGNPSSYSCPECGGVLLGIEEGSIVRFRCHTGHAYSVQTMLADIDADVDDHLWQTIRGLEERLLLADDLHRRAIGQGRAADAAKLAAGMERVRTRIAALRTMLLDGAAASEAEA